jgi:hypothetical protein
MSLLALVHRVRKLGQNLRDSGEPSSSSSPECGSSMNSDRELILESLRVVESWLAGGALQHYLGLGDLPIIVSHSFTSLMLLAYLHIV